ncbi:uncharacterized protein LOC109858489 isoform X3 [Pseudomyrmex gracilis]|uniref:uncharacterized protein LOC109858489 isoform X3 n=1 Tax=Pseudomyrmex gracilis TaxID=219809 RepID=UPI000994CF3D|nr:uncharacterized protein LOC109858489 isoform X3 [Pseudomyrmex gracilis]
MALLCVRKLTKHRNVQFWIQIFLIQCNLILSLVGIGGLTISILTKSDFFNDLILLDHYESLHVNVFFGCSIALIAIGWLGIFGGTQNSQKIIIANGMLLFGFGIGTTIYVALMDIYSDYSNTGELYKHMREEMKNYKDHKDIIDTLQTTTFGITLSYLQDRIINEKKKKKKAAQKDSIEIERSKITRPGPSVEIEDQGRDEVDKEKKLDEDEKNMENTKDDNGEGQSNACRNICKDSSYGRNIVMLHFH